MSADLRVGPEGVEDSDGVGGVHGLGDFVAGHPPDFGGFDGGGAGLIVGVAAEDEGDDAAVEVLVDAGEAIDGDVDAGFFEDLAADALFEGFVEFEDAAGWFPVIVVAAANDEDAVLVVDDDAGNADGVLRGVRHAAANWSPTVGLVGCLRVVGADDGNRTAFSAWEPP